MRTVVVYDHIHYVLPGEEPAAVLQRIDAVLRSEPFLWLDVQFGDGRPSAASLLISPATPFAVIAERGPDEQDGDAEAVSRLTLDHGQQHDDFDESDGAPDEARA